MSSGTIGNTYRVKVGAFNNVDEIVSDSTYSVLASVPDTPDAPTSTSDGTYLTILMTAPTSNGGDQIISYQLQVKYSILDDWTTVLGESTYNQDLTYTLTKTVSQGTMIYARYRCSNSNGQSDWSDTGYLTMAGIPERPSRPEYVSSDATSITLKILPSVDNNGAEITAYHLYRDDGDYSSTIYNAITGYDGVSTQYTVTGLTSGVKYRFAVTAENSVGTSDQSDEAIFVAASLPSKPTSVWKDSSSSNKTAIAVAWSKVADTETETSGYILKMAEYGSTQYTTIYDGTNYP